MEIVNSLKEGCNVSMHHSSNVGKAMTLNFYLFTPMTQQW